MTITDNCNNSIQKVVRNTLGGWSLDNEYCNTGHTCGGFGSAWYQIEDPTDELLWIVNRCAGGNCTDSNIALCSDPCVSDILAKQAELGGGDFAFDNISGPTIGDKRWWTCDTTLCAAQGKNIFGYSDTVGGDAIAVQTRTSLVYRVWEC